MDVSCARRDAGGSSALPLRPVCGLITDPPVTGLLSRVGSAGFNKPGGFSREPFAFALCKARGGESHLRHMILLAPWFPNHRNAGAGPNRSNPCESFRHHAAKRAQPFPATSGWFNHPTGRSRAYARPRDSTALKGAIARLRSYNLTGKSPPEPRGQQIRSPT